MTTTTRITPKLGSIVFFTADTACIRRVGFDQAIRLEEGEFLVTSYLGYNTIGRMTGRTRKFFRGLACPTIERFDIDTVVIDGAIWGVRGDRLPGTFATRPENIIN